MNNNCSFKKLFKTSFIYRTCENHILTQIITFDIDSSNNIQNIHSVVKVNIDANYFKEKAKDVLSFKKAEYNTRDILGEFCSIVGVDKKVSPQFVLCLK